jgi:hypothetical protein
MHNLVFSEEFVGIMAPHQEEPPPPPSIMSPEASGVLLQVVHDVEVHDHDGIPMTLVGMYLHSVCSLISRYWQQKDNQEIFHRS